MPLIADKGIILRRKNYLESDRLLTIYTKRHGKIRARAIGVRKSKSKLGGHLEPFYDVDLRLAEGKSFYTITQAEALKTNSNLYQDLPATSTIFVIAETVDMLTLENHPQAEIYYLLKDTIAFIDQQDFPLISSIFMLKMLFLLGYKIDLKACVVCGKKLEKQNIKFSFSLHGFIDAEDYSHDKLAIPIASDTIKLLRIAISGHKIFRRLKIPKSNQAEFINLVDIYRKNIIDNKIQSEKFFREMHANVD